MRGIVRQLQLVCEPGAHIVDRPGLTRHVRGPARHRPELSLDRAAQATLRTPALGVSTAHRAVARVGGAALVHRPLHPGVIVRSLDIRGGVNRRSQGSSFLLDTALHKKGAILPNSCNRLQPRVQQLFFQCYVFVSQTLLFDVSTTSTTTGNAERTRLQKEGKLQCVTRKEPATAAQSVTGSQLSPPPR